ncbi:hypothetical protein [Streptomyces sp. NBC_00996]|uniref:hypothetical protein n=1 Tax=Streptomyces sp. NBC_00996 TaxID=2903710 RepID=UPI00386A20FA|nr:hypothetical protein OG390_15270 [Streptomyces sp. NBC_00996]
MNTSVSDISTMEAPGTDSHEATAQAEGHGRHRGPISGHDDAAIPQGRHRKPSDQDNAA